MDLVIFNYIHGLTGISPLLDDLGIFCAKYLPYLVVLFLLSFLIGKNRFRKNSVMVALSLFAGLFARFVVKEIITFFYHRARPFVAMPNVHPLITSGPSEYFQSFPSGHVIFFFALSVTILFFNRKIGWWFIGASTIIGISRIFVGVHWPSDIFWGAVLGSLTAWVIYRIYLRYRS